MNCLDTVNENMNKNMYMNINRNMNAENWPQAARGT